MKKLLMTILTCAFLTSCESDAVKTTDVSIKDKTDTPTKNKTDFADTTKVISPNFSVNTKESVLNWKGSAIGKSHNGTVAVQSGMIKVSEETIIGGELIFDMATITCLDLNKSSGKGKLESHLKNPQFFNVDKFATSKIVIKSVSERNVTAELTIKDVTKSITFPATIKVTNNSVNVNAKLTVNRTDFGVVYASGNFFELAKDKAISDDIEFEVIVNATK